MTGQNGDPLGSTDPSERVRIQCQADQRIYDIDVSWTKGALFEFRSEERARAWVEEQNLAVPGRLFLEEAPDRTDGLSVDYHLKYVQP